MLATTTMITSRYEMLHVAVAGERGRPVETQARDAIERAVAEVERAGLPAGHIVRSRLWARDAAARQTASNVRLKALAGQRRAASSSFIDPQRLPAGSDMMIDLYALVSRAGADAKTIREYDPPIAPPQLVVLDGLLVLSGDTDRSHSLEQQMMSIRAKIDGSLAAGGGSWAKVVSIAAFLARRLPAGAGRAALAAHFPVDRCPVIVTPVDGYSNPEKLVEIEVTAYLR
jgi:enamine deaminase RidA (YjgF/YER057c/UK114 family)